MIAPVSLFEALKERGIGLFAGVPDSLLKDFCAYVEDHGQPREHIITANEGNAVALAAGYHMATGRIGAVYLQNSGLGNAINPLTSLTAPEVCRIPLLLIVGWRGEPTSGDEPQHLKQGHITREELRLLGIPHWIVDMNSDLNGVLDEAFATLESTGAPIALLIRKGTFSSYKSQKDRATGTTFQREEALRQVLDLANSNDLIVSTTGKTSRELFELRVQRNEPQRDFLTVGAMGHTSSIALGVALGNPGRRVLCLDGDGAMLMHLGALPIIGDVKPSNFLHILLNNGAHESVGGQPTVAGQLDFKSITRSCGYQFYHQAYDHKSLVDCWQQVEGEQGPVFLEIRICTGSRSDLGRPSNTPEQNKLAFMEVACD